MSTRSIIIIKNEKSLCRLYKHCDGGPDENLHLIGKALVESKRKTVSGVSNNICKLGCEIEHKTEKTDLNNSTLGYQTDLEWIYIVDLTKKTVDVYGGGYTDLRPINVLKKGKVKPLSYVNAFQEDYQEGVKLEIEYGLQRLKDLGFSINK